MSERDLEEILKMMSDPTTPMATCPHCLTTLTLGDVVSMYAGDDEVERARAEMWMVRGAQLAIDEGDQDL